MSTATKKASAVALAIAATLGACAPPSESCDCAPTVPPVEVVEAVERHRARILADTCLRDATDPSACALVERTFVPATSDERESILLVDDLPRLTTAMYRYRARLRGYYRPDTAGAVRSVAFTWRLPDPWVTALAELDGDGLVPAWWLTPLSEALHTMYGALLGPDVGHGSAVFARLVEEVPDTPIVLLDALRFDVFAPDLFCAPADDPLAASALRARAESVAASLAELIERENVRYVSYSEGWSLRVVRSTWAQICAAPDPGDDVLRARLTTFAPIADVLFATPGVVTAHAADASTNALDFPFDQRSPAYPNRVRVGFFEALDSGLDAMGRGDVGALDPWPDGAADVYLNSGVLPTRPFPYNETPMLMIDGFGASSSPVTSSTSSWITPLATARLVYLRTVVHAEAPFDDALVATLLSELTPSLCPEQTDGRCALQDPLRHALTPAFALHRRPPIQPE